ncbi:MULTISPECIES: hypothetical protein [Vibrio harveyi group]|uniref:hypothetical protein n=1 Tax=Vibrio harveyi group TaxID=717610 RepID=UPI001124418F|nr:MULTISPECIES: hypothetical protein [Vibrio harveyi group]ELI5379864.1 hypothetical protein [Vibrio parahaemolyticus]MCQ9060702.1 hypothetical protein [Vibrio alginolyticus]TOH73958.1 hypothetical protein CGI74_24210 [Vibrio parahaemolyticus]ULF91222.1 hypothetical protein K6754_13805 [Vibrio alginolyticus]
MYCISTFLEPMNHEFDEHPQIIVPRDGYKVDGEGIKKQCKLNTLKSVDYYEVHEKRGFLYVEFSDLIKQNAQINEKAKRISESNLPPKDKAAIRKSYFKEIHQELVAKYKDSVTIRNLIPEYIDNIPEAFQDKGEYIIVIAPIDSSLEKSKLVEIAKFVETLKDKVAQGIPKDLFTNVKVVNLEKFCI